MVLVKVLVIRIKLVCLIDKGAPFIFASIFRKFTLAEIKNSITSIVRIKRKNVSYKGIDTYYVFFITLWDGFPLRSFLNPMFSGINFNGLPTDVSDKPEPPDAWPEPPDAMLEQPDTTLEGLTGYLTVILSPFT